MEHEDLVAELQNAISGLIAAYLFGSAANGSERRDSDVDIAVLSPTDLDEVELWQLAQTLAARLGRSVDLVDLSRASTVMRSQIIATGVVLFDGDTAARRRFEGRAYADYVRLNEERREVLARIRSEGHVYGG
jgi:uncharacterized protein